MKNLLTRLIVLLLISLSFVFQTTNNKVLAMPEQKSTVSESISIRKLDKEAEILSAYLAKYNSPMQYHAQDFIDAAREYDLDWKMLPAIAGVESTFGKQIPGGYNAYGWAIYNSNSRFGFESWRHGMFVVAKGLRENYLNKGLTDPYSINRVYAASPTWGTHVSYFMNDLETFRKNYSNNQNISEDLKLNSIQIAATSGLLEL